MISRTSIFALIACCLGAAIITFIYADSLWWTESSYSIAAPIVQIVSFSGVFLFFFAACTSLRYPIIGAISALLATMMCSEFFICRIVNLFLHGLRCVDPEKNLSFCLSSAALGICGAVSMLGATFLAVNLLIKLKTQKLLDLG